VRILPRAGDYFVQAVDFRDVVSAGGHVRTEIVGIHRWRVHIGG
jgi:hypothetical protein